MMNLLNTIVNNLHKIIALVVLVFAIHFMSEIIGLVGSFNAQSVETKTFMKTSSFGHSVLGISIGSGLMLLAAAWFWNGSKGKK